jgi:hypothetical protein
MGRIVPPTRFDRANRHLAADFGLGVAFETHPHTGPRPETWPPASTGCDSFALRTADGGQVSFGGGIARRGQNADFGQQTTDAARQKEQGAP